jgi:hypothetical protein
MRRRGFSLWLALALGFTAAVALIVIGLLFTSSSRRPAIWLDFAKAGVQLLVVGVIGALIAFLFRSFEADREDRRREREYRLGVFHDLIAAYNGVKAARRTLRAFGFRTPVSAPLNTDQVSEYRAQLRSLNDINLSLERVERELESRPTLFTSAGGLQADVETAAGYVHDLIEEWESEGFKITEGTEASQVEALDKLQEFLGPAEGKGEQGIWNLSGQIERVQKKISPEL